MGFGVRGKAEFVFGGSGRICEVLPWFGSWSPFGVSQMDLVGSVPPAWPWEHSARGFWHSWELG